MFGDHMHSSSPIKINKSATNQNQNQQVSSSVIDGVLLEDLVGLFGEIDDGDGVISLDTRIFMA